VLVYTYDNLISANKSINPRQPPFARKWEGNVMNNVTEIRLETVPQNRSRMIIRSVHSFKTRGEIVVA